MITRFFLAVLLTGILAADGDDDKAKEQEGAPHVVEIRNVAPPIVIPTKEADVNGDGTVDDADVAAAENLAADDPYRLRFYAKLTTTWPVYGHIAKAADRLTSVFIQRFVKTCRNNRDSAAVVLVRWDAKIKDGLVGGTTWSIIDNETLAKLRAGTIVYVLDPELQMWKEKDTVPTRYFGETPDKTT